MSHVYWVDGVILAILALSMVTGFVRGLIKESVALCVWILAIWFAVHDFQLVAQWLAQYIADNTVRTLATVLLIIIGAVLIGSIINGALSFLLRRAGLSGTDRLLGMIFGLIRGIFIVSILILAANLTSLVSAAEYSKQSALYNQFMPIVNWLSSYTPGMINQMKVMDK